MKYTTTKIISLQDWDAYVEETYGRPYSFQQQDGCRERGTYRIMVPGEAEDFERDSIPEGVNGEEMGVSFAAWLARDPVEPIEGQEYNFERKLWWGRNFYPDVQMIANDLHSRGLLEAGEYTIKIDW